MEGQAGRRLREQIFETGLFEFRIQLLGRCVERQVDQKRERAGVTEAQAVGGSHLGFAACVGCSVATIAYGCAVKRKSVFQGQRRQFATIRVAANF